MGYFKKINLKNFRNFNGLELDFDRNCNVIFGNNGTGKTNILESITLFGKGRGLRNDSIMNIIKLKKENFINYGKFILNNNDYEIKIYSSFVNEKYKKNSSLNNETSKEINNFLHSNISTLYFLPDMERLFLSSPQFRRNFIDNLIFSYNKNYNKIINNYKKNLLERNNILKLNNYDENWLSKIEEKITLLGIEIYHLRNLQIKQLCEYFNKLNESDKYQFKISINIYDSFYNDDLKFDTYLKALNINRYNDSLIGGSKVGPHRSDFFFKINKDFPASQLSTGQQKTLVLLTLIAQCSYLINEKKIRPILLFDEVCSHLDDQNRNILLDLTNKFDIQVFLTGTDKSLFSFLSTNTKFCNI